MTDFLEFGFGKNDSSMRKAPSRFKAEAGKTYRISLAWWPTDDSGNLDLNQDTPTFRGCRRIYHPQAGYVLDKGPEYSRLLGKEGKTAIGTIIVVWPTDSKGKLQTERLKSGDYQVLPWVISTDKYDAISSIHDDWPLGQYDLKVACTDSQFQKLTINNYPENILAKVVSSGGTHANDIKEKVENIASGMSRSLARVYTLDELREKLGGEPTGPVDTGATGDVDDVIGDILD